MIAFLIHKNYFCVAVWNTFLASLFLSKYFSSSFFIIQFHCHALHYHTQLWAALLIHFHSNVLLVWDNLECWLKSHGYHINIMTNKSSFMAALCFRFFFFFFYFLFGSAIFSCFAIPLRVIFVWKIHIFPNNNKKQDFKDIFEHQLEKLFQLSSGFLIKI